MAIKVHDESSTIKNKKVNVIGKSIIPELKFHKNEMEILAKNAIHGHHSSFIFASNSVSELNNCQISSGALVYSSNLENANNPSPKVLPSISANPALLYSTIDGILQAIALNERRNKNTTSIIILNIADRKDKKGKGQNLKNLTFTNNRYGDLELVLSDKEFMQFNSNPMRHINQITKDFSEILCYEESKECSNIITTIPHEYISTMFDEGGYQRNQ